ncbi:sigma factor-like helix-turn-helix DNA-binding protein [Klebsiella michiganensis]|uniref:sigma factor-like helix-turn-helix DNA-binding protein n=1 Tax=Klebsiella michiganensis TaxID=1134687 RepID=UPI0009833621|nr:sigma factor-like helix-turn-helix DNA-binding protein [Klebsiella michiganensis]MCW9490401.1 hypothetical protein [Klebsiella michiganensis]
MCAMDRSSDDRSSQSVKDVIYHIKELYDSSPVSVCVRNQHHDVLYSNTAFEQIYVFFKAEGSGNSFLGSLNDVQIMLNQLEFDCMALGKGCVLSKIFSFGSSNFQVRMECINNQCDELYVLWQINLMILSPLSGRKIKKVNSSFACDFDRVMLEITDLNITPLSFYVLGFSYADISIYLGVSEKAVKKRVERSKEKISNIYPSFGDFIVDCYKTRKIYFFIENVYEYLMLKYC